MSLKKPLSLSFFVFGILFSEISFANNFFSNFDSIQVSYAKIYFIKENTKVFNIKRVELDPKHPLFSNEFEADDILVLETFIDKKKYFIIFSEGPSYDPEFQIYDIANYEYITSLSGLKLVIPGNGYLYTAGHTNNTFNKKQKYFFDGKHLNEVNQPFYYVGLTSKTLVTVKLYKNRTINEEEIVAVLPENYDVEVILTDDISLKSGEIFYLVKTSFGLLGWVPVRALQLKSSVLEGIIFKGD